MRDDLTPEEDEKIRKFLCASGYCKCGVCGKIYYDHKAYEPSGKTNNGVPWLNELCNGNLVKL